MKYPILACSLLATAMFVLVAPANSAETSAIPTKASHAHADWAGLWIGQEGLFVFVTATAPGQYTLEMLGAQDDTVTIPGKDAKNGISFERDGQQLLLRRSSGEEIGLKYLDGKKDCLMVQDGEGFCRD